MESIFCNSYAVISLLQPEWHEMWLWYPVGLNIDEGCYEKYTKRGGGEA